MRVNDGSGEANVAIIVGCLPPLQPLFKKIYAHFTKPNSTPGNSYEDRLARLKLEPGQYHAISKNSNDRSQLSNHTSHSVSKSNGSMYEESIPLGQNGADRTERPVEMV